MNVSEEQTDNTEVSSEAEPASEPVQASSEDAERITKRKLEEQLEALKRKEAELRRALVLADHPALADGIRQLQGRTYALERSEEKLALGLTKAELRRRETLQKKRSGLEDKRAELDAQIAVLDGELLGLGVERQQGFEAEHRQALEELMLALDAHLGHVQAAGLDVTELLPELARWLSEIEQLAARKTAN
ncbi:MAG TPA: hypothetical protein VFX59_25175 [Polyangiales bacterium]|nr:hypothetical protein [Polyangiales bacterium]